MEDTKNEIILVYCSVAIRSFDTKDIIDLLTISRKNNEKFGITGMLLYIDETFFQVLEGNKDSLHNLYKKIECDERHTKVVKLIEEPIDKRTFSGWSMGYAKATRAELSTIPGLNDFFVCGSSFNDLEKGRAKILLEAFREGKWRRCLTQ